MRRGIDWEDILNFNKGNYNFNNWKNTREYLIDSKENHYKKDILEPHFNSNPYKEFNGDFNMVPCCGDYQIASQKIWDNICGFEEELIYPLYSDTNVQKKAIAHGFNLKASYNPALFHINHGKGGGGFLDGINKKTNDYYRAISYQQKTENLDTWGFSNVEIEFEIF